MDRILEHQIISSINREELMIQKDSQIPSFTDWISLTQNWTQNLITMNKIQQQ